MMDQLSAMLFEGTEKLTSFKKFSSVLRSKSTYFAISIAELNDRTEVLRNSVHTLLTANFDDLSRIGVPISPQHFGHMTSMAILFRYSQNIYDTGFVVVGPINQRKRHVTAITHMCRIGESIT